MGKYLSTLTGLVENNHLYTVDIDTWEFLDWDLNTETCSILAELMPKEYKLCWIQKIIKYKNSFFFLQRNTKQIIEFNSITKEITRYGTEYSIYADDNLCYCDALIVDEQLMMLPSHFSGEVSIFDLKRKEYVSTYRLDNMICSGSEPVFDGRILTYYKTSGTTWFCLEKTNKIFCVDFLNLTSKVYSLDEQAFLDRIWGNEANIFCADLEKAIFYTYDKRNDSFIKITPNNVGRNDVCRFLYVTSQKRNYVVFTDKEDKLGVIKIGGVESFSIELPDDINAIFEMRNTFQKFSRNYILINNHFYALPFSGDSLIDVDLRNFDIKVHHLQVNGRDAIHSLQGKASAREYYDYGVKDLLDTIEFTRENECSEDSNNGERIYIRTKESLN